MRRRTRMPHTGVYTFQIFTSAQAGLQTSLHNGSIPGRIFALVKLFYPVQMEAFPCRGVKSLNQEIVMDDIRINPIPI